MLLVFGLWLALSLVEWPLVSGGQPAHAEIIERVVAIVNNEAITLHDLDSALAPLRIDRKDPELRRKVLEDLIHQKLLEQEVEKANIEVSDEELRRAIAGVLQNNQITIDLLKEELMAKGISFEAYKEQLKKQLRQGKFVQQNLGARVQITEQELQQYRKKNQREKNENISVRVATLFLKLPPKANAKDRRKLVRKGGEMADRVRKGEDFNKLGAEERTVLLRELSQDLSQVVDKMESGAVSDPILTPQGVYVIKLLEKTSGETVAGDNKSDDEIWQMLFNEKMNRELQSYVLRLRKKAYVEIRD